MTERRAGRHRVKMSWARTSVMVAFMLCAAADVQVLGHTIDVCATCHANATCDDKIDGSGKVCNCMYGFVGNGRTFCQDKDECQIGAYRICGQHTSCHNTYGSYYCTCMSGYSPSNSMAIFIPNDGTHCQDINECRVPGICGEGGLCRNLEGSFECHCLVGYQVHNGAVPFNPLKDKATCKVVDCGQPPSVENTVLLSSTGTTYGSVSTFGCDDGFHSKSGDSSSVCGANGVWTGLTMVCEEIDCGPPTASPHTAMLWDQTSRIGSEVVYVCSSGYRNVGKGNVSVCTAGGTWDESYVLCQEILCGDPPIKPHTGIRWDGHSAIGSSALYYCKEGYYYKGGSNLSRCKDNGHWTQTSISCEEIVCGAPPVLPHTTQVWNGNFTPGTTVFFYCKIRFYHEPGDTNVAICTKNGYWTMPNLTCKEVDCGPPPVLPFSVIQWNKTSTVGSGVVYHCKPGYRNVGHNSVSICTDNGHWNKTSFLCEEIRCGEPILKANTKIRWNKASHIGSVVYYQCDDGYLASSVRNSSLCREDGLWEDIDLECEEIRCGPPLTRPHTNLLWDNTTRPGSVAVYECMDAFYRERGDNISICLISGKWGDVSIKCKAKCGPMPVLAHSEVVWHNMSVAVHRCVNGYHGWKGSDVSVCGASGIWQAATLRCIEIKPAVHELIVFNEKCLRWKAGKYEEDTEDYWVMYTGSRDYQRGFRDKRKHFISSTSEQLELCLNLLPVTNYTISVTALSTKFTATVTANTSFQVPKAPVISYREVDTPIPTLRLHRSANTLDAISSYQVFVLPVAGNMVFDCTSDKNPDFSQRSSHELQYITAQISLTQVGTELNFTVGDGKSYGGFYNAPLQNGKDYYIIVRALTQWRGAFKSCCVLWARVKGTSYVIRITSLCAAGSIALIALVVLGGYSFSWILKFCKKP